MLPRTWFCYRALIWFFWVFPLLLFYNCFCVLMFSCLLRHFWSWGFSTRFAVSHPSGWLFLFLGFVVWFLLCNASFLLRFTMLSLWLYLVLGLLQGFGCGVGQKRPCIYRADLCCKISLPRIYMISKRTTPGFVSESMKKHWAQWRNGMLDRHFKGELKRRRCLVTPRPTVVSNPTCYGFKSPPHLNPSACPKVNKSALG